MDKRDAFIRDVYAAAAGDVPWEQITGAAAAGVGAIGGILYTPFLPESNDGLAAIQGVEDAPLRKALPDVAVVDLWYHGLLRRYGGLRTGLVWQSDDVVSDRDLLRSQFYGDYLAPSGIGRNIGLIVATADGRGEPDYVLSLYRPPNSKPFTKAHEAWLGGLRPHLHRALGLRHRLRSGGGDMTAGFLERLAHAVVVLDRSSKVLMANPAAEQVFVAGARPLVRDGRLCPWEPADRVALERAVKACADYRFDASLSLSVRLSGPPGQGVVARLTPAPDNTRASGRVAAMAFLSQEGKSLLDMASVMTGLYGLTPAEATLVRQLCDGVTLEEFAIRRQVSLATVKTQLRSVFSKTGTRRQSELMRLVFSIAH